MALGNNEENNYRYYLPFFGFFRFLPLATDCLSDIESGVFFLVLSMNILKLFSIATARNCFHK